MTTASGIFCEQQQEQWEQFLQPAVYAHNVSPISGTTNISPFFLVFGRDAPSPETIALDLPVHPLPLDHNAKHMLSCMKLVHTRFSDIKSDLHQHQKDIYDQKARFLFVHNGKVMYIRKEPSTHTTGMATQFLRNFNGPYLLLVIHMIETIC